MRCSALVLGLLAAWPGLAHAQVPVRPAEGPSPEPPPSAEAPAATPQPAAPVEPAASPPPVAEALPTASPAQLPSPRPAATHTVQTSPSEPDQAHRDVAGAHKPTKFYSALGLGAGYFHATSGADDDTRRFSGGSLALQLVMGGRTGKQRQLTVGGAYLRDQVFGLSSEDDVVDGDEPHLNDVSMGLWLLGFFMDAALKAEPGLHFQAIAGFSGLDVAASNRDTDDPFGLGLNLGVGYDISLGRHLALGALLRATWAPLDVDESQGTTVTSLAPSLLLTATTR